MAEHMSPINLATHYFNIANTALNERGRHHPYSDIIAVMNRLFSGETISLRIVDEKGEPLEYVTTGFVEGQFTPIREGVHHPDAKFTLSRDYLEEVMEHSDDYIRHPDRLDWSWLTAQLEPFGDSEHF
jgi:hypothetical protein